MKNSLPQYSVDFAPTELSDPVLAFVFDYWQKKRGDRLVPSRADIKPHELKAHLGSIILAEALPGYDDFRFRLVGTRVTQYFLGDATGKTLRQAHAGEGIPRHITDATVNLLRTACERPTWIRLAGTPGEWRDRYFPGFEALYLPLSENGETANLILSPFSFDHARLRVARESVGSPM